MLNTMPYGGGLWHTWFDRDLGLAGRIIFNKDDLIHVKTFRIDVPIARIPNLAIHLTSGKEREDFSPNLHEHAKAILSMDEAFQNTPASGLDAASRIHPGLLHMVAKAAEVDPACIEDIECQLIDIQPSSLGGASGELLFSGRLDNLCSSYQSLRALIDSASSDNREQTNVKMIMLFDHEEVGSSSCQGAGSSLLMNTLQLINDQFSDKAHGME
jgi:aspartyl aminopeptidase